ncbi:hypothetical protein BDV41DRAFT_538125 [Aspergillus transmontanensis]|uniref:Zn(2)-C6 fungal-type domain-containing protein n=1 Tax=Aspergillus transmontanensis TaxID=1034304 RepID=A0A5N6VW30_9EURO|nr:hypothetical protein BDV41DRAFT_538125 [Aspergillus transmontanensis]
MQRQRRWQVPISCQHCRTMKLKCDRDSHAQVVQRGELHAREYMMCFHRSNQLLQSHVANGRRSSPSASVAAVPPPSHIFEVCTVATVLHSTQRSLSIAP